MIFIGDLSQWQRTNKNVVNVQLANGRRVLVSGHLGEGAVELLGDGLELLLLSDQLVLQTVNLKCTMYINLLTYWG